MNMYESKDNNNKLFRTGGEAAISNLPFFPPATLDRSSSGYHNYYDDNEQSNDECHNYPHQVST